MGTLREELATFRTVLTTDMRELRGFPASEPGVAAPDPGAKAHSDPD